MQKAARRNSSLFIWPYIHNREDILHFPEFYAIISKVDTTARCAMEISYNKLWKLLIDKKMNKTDLRSLAHLSSGTIAKLGKNENVTTDVLVRICAALNCDIADIMELEVKDIT